MSKSLLYQIGSIVLLIIVAATGYSTLSPTLSDFFSNTTPFSALPTAQKEAVSTQTAATVKIHTVSITNDGFKPKSLSIAVGDIVRFVNEDTNPHWPASDPHPTHTAFVGFDPLGNLSTGESYSHKFTELGNFFYHDHAPAFAESTEVPTGVIKVKSPTTL